jgi:hypothetical protein
VQPITVAPQNEEADVRKFIKRTVCAVAILFGSFATLAVTADYSDARGMRGTTARSVSRGGGGGMRASRGGGGARFAGSRGSRNFSRGGGRQSFAGRGGYGGRQSFASYRGGGVRRGEVGRGPASRPGRNFASTRPSTRPGASTRPGGRGDWNRGDWNRGQAIAGGGRGDWNRGDRRGDWNRGDWNRGSWNDRRPSWGYDRRDYVRNDFDINVDNGWYPGWGWNDNWGWGGALAAGAAAAVTSAAIGAVYYSLPPSCAHYPYGGYAYYRCGSSWYEPQYYGDQVTYVAVEPPY